MKTSNSSTKKSKKVINPGDADGPKHKRKETNDALVKNSMGVFCKCGKIIYAVSCEFLKEDKESRKDLMMYITQGYRVENVSKAQVKELYGCSCDDKVKKTKTK